MKKTFHIEFTVELDEVEASRLHGEKWVPALLESAEEFVEELRQFLEKHPFVEAASVLMGDRPL